MSKCTAAAKERSTWNIWQVRRRRWFGAIVVMGLALVMVACGASGGAGIQPTPTPSTASTATATPTPPPCTSWRIVPSPNMAGYPESELRAVSAPSPSVVWAVGVAKDVGTRVNPWWQSLVEQWDGTTWRIVPSAGFDALNSVAAISPNDVWAVGGQVNYGAGNHSPAGRPLIMHWNGSKWSVVPSGQTATPYVELDSVAAISANDVWAVGLIDTGPGQSHPLVERWDGNAWHVVGTPDISGAVNSGFRAAASIPGTEQLWAVDWAVGRDVRDGFERWDGTAWKLVAGPVLPSGALGGRLNGMVALSATDAWAVGSYMAGNEIQRTLIAHWDGTSWTMVPQPDTRGELLSVAAAGPHDVRAVGHAFSANGNTQVALALQWDGTTWHVVTLPAPAGATTSSLTSVTGDGAGNFWAVGSYRNAAGNERTLIENCA
ncbi:MAG TPA: hypothetical protein VFU88_13150 [Ktedonobacterales bacterium]|nr:hypothetical protein [Ktedonobacterales bacterium]